MTPDILDFISGSLVKTDKCIKDTVSPFLSQQNKQRNIK